MLYRISDSLMYEPVLQDSERSYLPSLETAMASLVENDVGLPY